MSRLYWITTALITAEGAGGGIADLLRSPPFYPVMIDLGYPPYLATILGTAKLIAAAVIAAPALPRLKEWAYAGLSINFIGAMASHVAMHRSLTNVIAPAAFLALTLTSWATRPPSRILRAGAARVEPAGGARR
jgi:DoxX-like family